MKKVLLLILCQIFLISFKIDSKAIQTDDKSNKEELIKELYALIQQLKNYTIVQEELKRINEM